MLAPSSADPQERLCHFLEDLPGRQLDRERRVPAVDGVGDQDRRLAARRRHRTVCRRVQRRRRASSPPTRCRPRCHQDPSADAADASGQPCWTPPDPRRRHRHTPPRRGRRPREESPRAGDGTTCAAAWADPVCCVGRGADPRSTYRETSPARSYAVSRERDDPDRRALIRHPIAALRSESDGRVAGGR